MFDTSVYVRLQQAHGTGGDLYIEAYDYTDDCNMSKLKRDISMGIGDSHTLAMEPQEGWEIEKITIDGKTVMFKGLTFNDGVATYEFNVLHIHLLKIQITQKKLEWHLMIYVKTMQDQWIILQLLKQPQQTKKPMEI